MKKTDLKIIVSKVLLPSLLSLYIKTISKKFINSPGNYLNKIFVFWHSKMFIGWWIFKNKNFSALVSKSSDGELLANILKKWKFNVIRGSSSRGGKEALEEILSAAIEIKSIAITPDGPRGPTREFKNGPLIISNQKKYEIIPVKITYSKKIILRKSWDKFEIPYPFTKCIIKFGKPFLYSNYLYDDNLINFKQEICSEL